MKTETALASGPYELRTKRWFVQTDQTICRHCRRMARALSIFVGPESEIRDINGPSWMLVENFACVVEIAGLDRPSGGLLMALASGDVDLSGECVGQRCEHCGGTLEPSDSHVAAMDRFSSGEAVTSRVEIHHTLTARAMKAMRFHDDIDIVRQMPRRDGYACVVRLQVSDSDGELATAEFFHHVEHGDFGLIVKDGSGCETFAFGFETGAFESIRRLVECVLSMGYAVVDVVAISQASIFGQLAALMTLAALRRAGYEIERSDRDAVTMIREAVETELAIL